jgi:hypothetical protein
MWYLAILVIFNAVANNTDVILAYRLFIGGLPLNILDGLTLLGLLIAAIPAGRRYFRTARPHPLLPWIAIVFTVAALGGLLAGSLGGVPLRAMVTSFRNFLTIPACIFIGYRLIKTPQSLKWMMYIYLIAGVWVAILVILYFLAHGAQVYSFKDVNALRTVQYESGYADSAVWLLVFSVLVRAKILPLPVTVAVAVVCLGGAWAGLHRNEWVASVAGVCLLLAMLPAGRRLASAAGLACAMVFLLLALWVGIIWANQFMPNHDLRTIMYDRVQSLIPGYTRETHRAQAWDTRVGGAVEEFKMWTHSPLVGRGFGIQELDTSDYMDVSYNHNAWTATLAQTGLVGLAAMLIVHLGGTVAAWRLARATPYREFVLVGTLGFASFCVSALSGLMTMSFNVQRPAMALALLVGSILRARAMQVEMTAQQNLEASPAIPTGSAPEARAGAWGLAR